MVTISMHIEETSDKKEKILAVRLAKLTDSDLKNQLEC